MSFKRLWFVLKMFVLPFSKSMKISMLFELYFHVADSEFRNHYSMVEYLDNVFYKYGYNSSFDYVHFITYTKLIHFEDNDNFFETVPFILRKTVILKAIKACIDHHQYNIKLPEYNNFVAKHTGFYPINY